VEEREGESVCVLAVSYVRQREILTFDSLSSLFLSDSIIEEKGSGASAVYIILLSKSAFDHES
jgi:hypothetical protein